MRRRITNLLWIFFIIFGGIMPLLAQKEMLPHPPPQKENTYLFSIHRYNRQPRPTLQILNRIAQIHANPMDNWTGKDSLYYAYENVYLKKFELALNVFIRLKIDTIKSKIGQILYRTTLQHTHRFKKLIAYNRKTISDDQSTPYSISDAFDDLAKAYLRYSKKKTNPDSIIIFPILKDSVFLRESSRNVPPFRNNFSRISYAIDSALRQFSVLNKNQDVILAKAFKEMAIYQEQYLYITNAYFYFSGSLYYYKKDKFVINERNRVIDKMTNRNYISIKFTTLFGKIAKQRYNFSDEYIKESREKKISTQQIAPPTPLKKKDYLPNVNGTLLMLIGFFIILVLVMAFVKTERKK